MATSAPPLRVLVVDDHPDITMSLAALMRLEHFDVQTAGDGFIGLENDRHFSKPTDPFKLMALLKQTCNANG